MITIKTTYEQISKDYPEVAQEFLDNLRNSASKNKNIKLEKIKWFISWGTFSKKPKTDEDRVLKEQYIRSKYSLEYNERWLAELPLFKVEIMMEAGSFLRGDRCMDKPLPEFITRYAKELLKPQMMAEQNAMDIKNQSVIDSIPEVDKSILEEIIPPSLKEMIAGQNLNKSRKPQVTLDLDDILDKISDEGMDSLSDEEKDFLKNQ